MLIHEDGDDEVVAHSDGLPCPDTMWRLAHPYDDLPDDDEVAEEEARVLDIRKALETCAPRPCDLDEVPVKGPLAW